MEVTQDSGPAAYTGYIKGPLCPSKSHPWFRTVLLGINKAKFSPNLNTLGCSGVRFTLLKVAFVVFTKHSAQCEMYANSTFGFALHLCTSHETLERSGTERSSEQLHRGDSERWVQLMLPQGCHHSTSLGRAHTPTARPR